MPPTQALDATHPKVLSQIGTIYPLVGGYVFAYSCTTVVEGSGGGTKGPASPLAGFLARTALRGPRKKVNTAPDTWAVKTVRRG